MLGGSAALYTLAAVVNILFIYRREFGEPGRWASRAAWVVHTAGFTALVATVGRAPVYTLFEFTYFFTWALMTGYMAFDLVRSNQAPGAILVPLVAVLQVVAVALPKPSPDHLPGQELPASLTGWHIGIIMLGYVFFILSFVAGVLYLFQERNLRQKRWGPLYYRLPSLETLDRWSSRFVYVGLPLLTIGVISGAVFAELVWHRLWQMDPKVVFTVVVWLVYGGYLVTRRMWGWSGRRAAWWSVAGGTVVLINYLLINMLSHLHRFGV